MNSDPLLPLIVEELRKDHLCHTVILYGSRARGEETPTSDYDLMGVRESGESYRIARLWNGFYLDIFIHAESKISQPDETLLHMRTGRVLCQKENLGEKFLARLEEIFQAGPKRTPESEIQVLDVWAQKSLARIQVQDIEGNFRRAELLTQLLSDYFTTRGMWYRGPKESFRWLKQNQPDIYNAFDHALKPGAETSAIKKLIHLLTKRE
jgi:predicted nucleotidyltransferase